MSKSAKKTTPPGNAWEALTWDDLDGWAGSRSVTRGRSYQRSGRVTDLRITPDGRLLATVAGTHRYATTVSLAPKAKKPSLGSACSCPIGGNCKHAVAVVAQYLDAMANEREVPLAFDEDPRWAKLEERATGTNEEWDEGRDWDEDDEDDEDWEDEIPVPRRPASKRAAAGSKAATNWDEKIEQHIRAKPPGELADLVWSLVKRYPELYREFKERLSLQEGNVEQLVAEARRDIAKATREPGWQNRWNNEGYTPDFTPIRHRFERLLELGHADEVVSLGREFIRRGLQQVGSSNDEGETVMEFREPLEAVFRAVMRSKLTASERLLFAIDAELADDYDAIGEASEVVFDAPAKPADWSAVADALSKRINTASESQGREADSFNRRYERDKLTNWLARALEAAGRTSELDSIYEAEARRTGSYERLVGYLLEQGRKEDAERWAKEGIAATILQYPGIASHLAGKLCELAVSRKQWDVVAAHAAHDFFERPSPHSFQELIKAAGRAKVEDTVRTAALKFLETGTSPIEVIGARPRWEAPPPRTATRKKAASPPPPPPPAPSVKIDPSWPLPVPEYLVAQLLNRRGYDPGPRKHLDVLLDMAIAAKKSDEVLKWFERMQAEPKQLGYSRVSGYAERVADAVAKDYPERAIETYRKGLEAQLPHADPNAYSAATKFLRKLRPLYESLGRSAEWTALVQSIREKHKNRPRFMELLDTLEGRTIVQTTRKKPR